MIQFFSQLLFFIEKNAFEKYFLKVFSCFILFFNIWEVQKSLEMLDFPSKSTIFKKWAQTTQIPYLSMDLLAYEELGKKFGHFCY